MDLNEWYYNGATFGDAEYEAAIEAGYIGFIYLIKDVREHKFYIGKKLLIGKRRLKPLKGKARKRIKMVESDWKTYFGSSELVQELVAERPDDFHREILYLCKTKGELGYTEAREQFAREVLLRDDYYNSFVGCKIHAKHVLGLKKERDSNKDIV